MPSIITRGAFSAKAFGFTGKTTTPVYVEDVFSTYLYTGTGSDQVLTTGIDLSTKGGLVWSKRRSNVAESHFLQDTLRGLTARLSTNNTNAQTSSGAWPMNALSTTGMTVSGVSYAVGGETYVSWTFRKQPKFFDVVTYTGTGSAQTIAHNLGATPAFMTIKCTSSTGAWRTWSSALTSPNANWWRNYMSLNQTTAALDWGSNAALSQAPDATSFYIGNDAEVNTNGATYVVYLFANQAGGFGLSGSDSVVACGSFTTDGSGNVGTINLGWEPQYILCKTSSATQSWFVFDTMRGWAVSGAGFGLQPNTTSAELDYFGGTPYLIPTATGFSGTGNFFGANTTVIYLAIRRGPMKVPTSGTSVFLPSNSPSSSSVVTTGFPVDSLWSNYLPGYAYNTIIFDRLRGNSSNSTALTSPALFTSSTSAEDSSGNGGTTQNWSNVSYTATAASRAYYAFRRAPGFMDEVCYTGTGLTTTVTHNLGVKPELMFIKVRTVAGRNWIAAYGTNIGGYLNTTSAINTGNAFIDLSSATSTTFPSNANPEVGQFGQTYVAYLFATCPGVSKVGSYTGTGAAQNIDCGFSSGARFVLIKRIDNSGSWYVYDSARGISSGNDPYLVLNTTAAEVTGTNYVDTYASGFSLTASAPAEFNANGGSYLFLAIA